MRKIAVLDQHTIDKIAAGEVVERPSSVVKELVENAIDAGATAVTVEITEGGKKLMRITDNGSGMEADQVRLAFLRHATSKIEKVEDLENIASLGFRGEALSSIAAVSQVELITKTPSSISGTRYIIEGGQEISLEELGAPEGTTFLIRNLFYNTPARSKFLKSDMAEGNYIGALMEQLALSHPEIAFKYMQNKQVKLYTSGNNQIKDVIYSIYGRDITKSLLPVETENDFMKVTGFVGKPEISRGNRTFESYAVNGRYVKNNIITKAIEDAYKGFLMQHKFPFVSLHIEMNGNDLDVNVHPRKMEVRFARGPEVYDTIYQTIREVLTRKEMIPSVPVGKEERTPKEKTSLRSSQVPEPFEHRRREQLYTNRVAESVPYPKEPSSFSKEEEAWFSGTLRENQKRAEEEAQKKQRNQPQQPIEELPRKSPVTEPQQQYVPKQLEKPGTFDIPKRPEEPGTPDIPKQPEEPETPDISRQPEELNTQEIPKQPEELNTQKIPRQPEEPEKEATPTGVQLELFEEKLLAPESRSRHQLIGQLFDTYWLVQFEDQFYIIDQHAAHEKVYYERLVKQFQNQEITSQYLSPPLVVTLSPREETLLKANETCFQKFGFEIEPFGGKEYCISAVPSNLYGAAEEALFLDMLDQLSLEGEQDMLELFTARLATMACKAAVKGNHRMSAREAEQLIDELLTLENPYHCPHGRPTIISMSRTEIEKKFKRIV